MSNIIKLYAAYKAGYLGDNILNTYFAFIANIILDEKITTIEDAVISTTFKKRYMIELPLPFIRQVLGIGVKNKCFISDRGKYSVITKKLSEYRFDKTDFDTLFEQLIVEFEKYCLEKDIDITSYKTNEFILDILDRTDDLILSEETTGIKQGILPQEYAWFSFVKSQAEKKSNLYNFIAAISASNITLQALFFESEATTDYPDLHVYLDSPIIFSLLGMDESSRTNSYKTLISDMLKAKCNIHVLDHNFQEVDSIIARAAAWATSTEYDLRKANNASRFFHDSQMSNTEISEFCERIEHKLNDLGITVVETNYDLYSADFQEDEELLFNMIQERYDENE